MPIPITPLPESPQHPPMPPEPSRRHIEDPDPWLLPAPVQDPLHQPAPTQIHAPFAASALQRLTRFGTLFA